MQDSQVFKGDGIHKALAGRSEAGPDLISMILVPSSLVGVSVAVSQLLQSGLSVSRLNSYSFRKISGPPSKVYGAAVAMPQIARSGVAMYSVCHQDISGPVHDCGLLIWTPRWCRNSELSVAQCF